MKITSLFALASCILLAHGDDSKSKAGKVSPSKSKGSKIASARAEPENGYKVFAVSLRVKDRWLFPCSGPSHRTFTLPCPRAFNVG